MGTTLATKSDLELLRVEFRQELALVRKDQETLVTTFHKDLELLSTRMTVRLGSMLMLGLGLLFAALKLT